MEEGDQETPEWAVGPEDEIDALNDETFGGGGEDYTWEDSQTLFQELHKDPDVANHSSGASNGFNSGSAQTAGTQQNITDARSKETEYYDYENDSALEESISRLVLDDMEDTEDEEEARKMKLSRLGAASNFNTYFMPPQVATKHLHWLMDKELPGGSSLLGSSVWSMHPTTTPMEDASTIQNSSVTPSRAIQPPTANITPKQHSRANHLLHDDFLDTENIGKFFGGVPSSTPLNSSVANKKPVFKTVEELERELLDEDLSKAQSENAGLSNSVPKMLMAEDLEREMIDEAPTSSENVTLPRSPLRNLSHTNQAANQDPVPFPPGLPKQQQHVMQQPHGTPPNVNFNNMTGPGGPAPNSVNNFIMMEQHKQLMLARQGLIPPPPHGVLHPGMLPPGAIPPQIAQGFHGLSPLQQHNIRMLQINPHLRGRMPMMMPLPAVLPQMRPPIPPQQMGFPPHQGMMPGFRRPLKTDDPYRGLMNEKDKQRLRNIQIIQLQNDHPFTTDYYNLMHKAKQAAPSGLQLLVKLYPKRDDESSQKSQYEPARFENCLGKLQAVSALAPKRVIDTFIRVTECRNASRGGVKAYRYLLLEIEKLYECLLIMEESDIRVSILCNADLKDIVRRSQTAEKVAKVLTNNEKFLNVLSVPKGKMLICRALPLIDPSLRYKVLGHLFDVFPLFESQDISKAFPYLRHCIFNAEIKDLLTVIGSVTDSQIFETVVISKLGITLLTCIYYQAENLLLQCEPMLVEDLETHWTRKSSAGMAAILVKRDEVANPIELYPNILQHIRRFALQSNEVQVVESLIQQWASARIPARVMPMAQA